ncbi:response regulator [Dactylosporangium roseum]|uniref:Transcriptional regulatory protein n=1 Tax=Dactylosporangium roseum TaxID=47989 RepID=A0ABY5YY92_9ACTN|nr:response regulator [Dactylosporangium roseum]UWZ34369.1 response regulator [Dactylosporangium roseum]
MIRVLVVDDDFMVARVHSGFVERTPEYEVVGTAHTGAEAIESVVRLRPDLVLLDIYLPDMTGLEVIQQLRAHAATGVDVIVVSAARDAESVKQALRGGVVSYLIKPFRYQDLRERLEQYAEWHRSLGDLTESRREEARQEDIDRFFARRTGGAAPSGMPKGITAETIELVRNALRSAGGNGLSAAECAESIGISRASARRYLQHLATTGAAEVRSRYGSTGRPERRFRAIV